jgi:hypothetical protein
MEISVNIMHPALAMTALLGGFTEAANAHPRSPESARILPVLPTGPTSPAMPVAEGSYNSSGERLGNSANAMTAFWGKAQRNGH